MLVAWKKQFSATKSKASLVGWGFEDEAECKAYLAKRVKARIQESDTASILQDYLVEMADTGFDTSALQDQIERPPKAKDWEIGEAFAEVMLEDEFEAAFPWPTSWDKRTPKASLPGPDMPGFHRLDHPRFLFGEVKSSSEAKTPPQVANSGADCLCEQMKRLLTSQPHRQRLIEWMLVRAKDSDRWKPIFDEAIKQYASGDACICGVLVRGEMQPNAEDLAEVHEDVAVLCGTFDVMLMAFYLPFHKSQWVGLIYGTEAQN